jgi:hypothetical protein
MARACQWCRIHWTLPEPNTVRDSWVESLRFRACPWRTHRDFTQHLRSKSHAARCIKDYFDAANPRPLATGHLGTATTRIIYDLDRVPACAAIIARETYVSDLAVGEQTKAQLSFVLERPERPD